jgi:hypothetical protein
MGGVIFSDGMESGFPAFNSGTEEVITLAQKRSSLQSRQRMDCGDFA